MVFDPAIAEAVAYALSNPPPAMVGQMSPEPGQSATQFRAQTEGFWIDHWRRYDKWRASGDEARTALLQLIAVEHDRAGLSAFLGAEIERVEKELVETSKLLHKASSNLNRLIKVKAKQQPKIRDTLELSGREFERSCQREIEDRSDFILFMRSLHADMSPTKGRGPVFENPKSLEQYLTKLVS